MESQKAFENVSQRVVNSYQRALAEFTPVMPEHLAQSGHDAMSASQKTLHDFFQAFYERVYQQPEIFGLPVAEDVSLGENVDQKTRQAKSRKIKKPLEAIEYGLDFLFLLGQQGTLAGQTVQLEHDAYAAFLTKQPRVKKAFLKGMEAVGLSISETANGIEVQNIRYSEMMPALQVLAQACAQNADEYVRKFHFARCDFKALDPQYQLSVLDFLRMYSSSEYQHAVEIHTMLTGMGYTPTYTHAEVCDWEIKYQGKRAVKATPLFQFQYSIRHARQARPHIKCAAANRISPVMPSQPESLQQDFYARTFQCAGAKCGWCKNRKSLGPSVLKYNGEKKTICWHVPSDIAALNADTVALVKQ